MRLLDELLLTAQQAEVLRARLGGKPLRVVSGVRCDRHNRVIGGAKLSRHITGMAGDYAHPTLSGEQMRAFALELMRGGDMVRGGLGIYAYAPGTLHMDRRGEIETWEG